MRHTEEEIIEKISKTPQIEREASDSVPPAVAEPGIDKEKLGKFLLDVFEKDVKAKMGNGWIENVAYDEKSYYGIKDQYLSQIPWPNSSNFPEPITPALLDTGHSNLLDAQFPSRTKMTTVSGIGPEDVRSAGNLEKLVNAQLLTEMDTREFMDEIDFDTLLHGTGILKVLASIGDDFQVTPRSVDIENIYTHIDAQGFKTDQMERITQIVPLTLQEKLRRVNARINGKKVYEGLENLPAGFKINGVMGDDELRQIQDEVSGTDTEKRKHDDLYSLAESYVSYQPDVASKTVELVVWWSPFTGQVFRVVENTEKVRPFARFWLYDYRRRFFKRSLPNLLKNIQEKADYTDKQVTDAADKAIMPAGFFEEGGGFDPDVMMRVPGGMYPIRNPNTINWERVEMGAILERGRQLDVLWDKAERLSGFTPIFQGRQPERDETLGAVQLRTNKADVRFSTIFERMNRGWNEFVNLVYYYDDKYMPREKKVRLLGTNDFQTVDELFPHDGEGKYGVGLTGKFDFEFSGKPRSEIERKNFNVIQAIDKVMQDPGIGDNVGNVYRLRKRQFEAFGIDDFEMLVMRPPDANILSPEEAINRAMSGQKEVMPELTIDAQYWSTRIKMFMRSESFKMAPVNYQGVLEQLLGRVEAIRKGQVRALQDAAILRQGQPGQVPVGGNGGAPVTAGNVGNQ